MTHVELIVQEKNRYIADGKAMLDEAMSFLHYEADLWDSNREEIYQSYLRAAEHNMCKATALCELLKKVGV